MLRVPSVGSPVLFVLDRGPNEGQVRPGFVVRVWGNSPESACQLQVLVDGTNDFPMALNSHGLYWVTSCSHATPIPGEPLSKRTFHYPEEALTL
jgi:hypothetical protein